MMVVRCILTIRPTWENVMNLNAGRIQALCVVRPQRMSILARISQAMLWESYSHAQTSDMLWPQT